MKKLTNKDLSFVIVLYQREYPQVYDHREWPQVRVKIKELVRNQVWELVYDLVKDRVRRQLYESFNR
jgi:hypothetical protein